MRGHGLVPTMGALHDGHAALIKKSANQHPETVVSIFVNPLQFGPQEDLSKYPRTQDADLEICKKCGATHVFMPETTELTDGQDTTITVSGVSERFEGEARPGHFEGVATIVLKLFNITRPKSAFFGLKDLQQCAVINKMVQDLNVPVELSFVETVREPSGLAMSSRNRYFSPEQLEIVNLLPRMLRAVVDRTAEHESNFQIAVYDALNALNESGFQVDYFELVDPSNMEITTPSNPNARCIVAARIFGVRLIDNLPIKPLIGNY